VCSLVHFSLFTTISNFLGASGLNLEPIKIIRFFNAPFLIFTFIDMPVRLISFVKTLHEVEISSQNLGGIRPNEILGEMGIPISPMGIPMGVPINFGNSHKTNQ